MVKDDSSIVSVTAAPDFGHGEAIEAEIVEPGERPSSDSAGPSARVYTYKSARPRGLIPAVILGVLGVVASLFAGVFIFAVLAVVVIFVVLYMLVSGVLSLFGVRRSPVMVKSFRFVPRGFGGGQG